MGSDVPMSRFTGTWWVQFGASPARRDFWALLVDRGSRLAVGMVLSGLVGRYLGATAFGWLNYATSVMMLAASVAHLGLDGIIVRDAAKQPHEANEILGAAFLARVVVGLVFAVGTVAMAGFLAGGVAGQAELIAILAWGALVPALGIPALWFQARTESRVAVRVALVGFLVAGAARLGAIYVRAPVAAFAWIALAESALGFGLVLLAMKRRGGGLPFRATHVRVRGMLRDSWPLLVGGIAATIYLRIDQVMLNWLLGADAVGVYAAATRLSDAAYGVPLVMGSSLMATLTSAFGDKLAFDGMVERYFRTSAALGYLLLLPLVLVAPWLLHLLYGTEFSAAGRIAQIHLLSLLFVSMSVARGRVLIVLGLTKFAMTTALAGCVVNIALNLLWIPVWGLAGAAWAAVVAHLTAGIGMTLLYPKTRSLGIAQVRALVRPGFRLKT